jgi:hypothetical protein
LRSSRIRSGPGRVTLGYPDGPAEREAAGDDVMASGQLAQVHVEGDVQLRAPSGQIGVSHGPPRDLHRPILLPKGGQGVWPFLRVIRPYEPAMQIWWRRACAWAWQQRPSVTALMIVYVLLDAAALPFGSPGAGAFSASR